MEDRCTRLQTCALCSVYNVAPTLESALPSQPQTTPSTFLKAQRLKSHKCQRGVSGRVATLRTSISENAEGYEVEAHRPSIFQQRSLAVGSRKTSQCAVGRQFPNSDRPLLPIGLRRLQSRRRIFDQLRNESRVDASSLQTVKRIRPVNFTQSLFRRCSRRFFF
jgi:hypothetical protein